MIRVDVDTLLRQLALRSPSLVELAGTRIYMASEVPPGYDPAPKAGRAAITGPAVLLTNRGGRPSATSVLSEPTYQARCYAVDERTAQELDGRLFEALHDKSLGRIRAVRCNVTGQHTEEPDTEWHFYLSTWQLTVVIG